MTPSIEIIVFPKTCPHCGVVMKLTKKLHCSWLECHNFDCEFLKTQEALESLGGQWDQEPFPYTYGYMSR